MMMIIINIVDIAKIVKIVNIINIVIITIITIVFLVWPFNENLAESTLKTTSENALSTNGKRKTVNKMARYALRTSGGDGISG